ncbi:MAG: MGMT family protein [Bacteroidia bacterium]|nr:MGMT family protein [Bacteroidia bacterium]MDW8159328.1 MGMT family protein [Bacteroidia bacterium]
MKKYQNNISFANQDFFQAVYAVVAAIPPGRVTTYGAIANFLSIKGAARMVGYALNHSHKLYPPIPAHRVVNRNGLLTGKHHFATPTLMQELLEAEGICVEKDQVINFDKVFWDPTLELSSIYLTDDKHLLIFPDKASDST